MGQGELLFLAGNLPARLRIERAVFNHSNLNKSMALLSVSGIVPLHNYVPVPLFLYFFASISLNCFRAKGEISSGAVEGLNNKIRVVTRRSYGFRTFNAMEVALYHNLGRLPEPPLTHRFC